MTKDEAISKAKRLSRLGREHVVRNRGFSSAPEYIVVPRYELGAEGYRHDAGYANQGTLVWSEDLDRATVKP